MITIIPRVCQFGAVNITRHARKYSCWLTIVLTITEDEEYELIFEQDSHKFGIAPHSFETTNHTLTQSEDIVKLAKAGDYYQIMKNVGGGGGHRLKIEDFKITIHYKPYYEPREIWLVIDLFCDNFGKVMLISIVLKY